MNAYYNEIDPYCVEWLRNLIAAGHIAPGDVDDRSISDVQSDDLKGYTQCHFFAGIAGWSLALRIAGWPDDRPVWTGSCPCQSFSTAGKRQGVNDDRDLWPTWFAIIRERTPPVVFGEQVKAAIGFGWLDRLALDLESEGYAFGSAVLPACAVSAPHERQRLWFVADAGHEQPSGRHQATQDNHRGRCSGLAAGNQPAPSCGSLADSSGAELQDEPRRRGGTNGSGEAEPGAHGAAQSVADAAHEHEHRSGEARPTGRDEFANGRRHVADTNGRHSSAEPQRLGGGCGAFEWSPEPDLPRVAHGIPARVAKLRALGNAIVPALAAQFIQAVM